MAEIKKKRGKGRPPREESIAIQAEKEIVNYKEMIVKSVPKAIETLIALMDNGTEKIKENVSMFIIEEAKKIDQDYGIEDAETEVSSTVPETQDRPTAFPITKQIIVPLKK